jgi:hypothetical protein
MIRPRTVCFQEGENDEDMTCLDMTIQALSTRWTAFHQEAEDDENMTLLHTTIRCKDKVGSFLYIFLVILRVDFYLKILL